MTGPNPAQMWRTLSLEDADKRRNLNCGHYESCLEVAVMRGWRSFACSSCNAYVEAPKILVSKNPHDNAWAEVLDVLAPTTPDGGWGRV